MWKKRDSKNFAHKGGNLRGMQQSQHLNINLLQVIDYVLHTIRIIHPIQSFFVFCVCFCWMNRNSTTYAKLPYLPFPPPPHIQPSASVWTPLIFVWRLLRKLYNINYISIYVKINICGALTHIVFLYITNEAKCMNVRIEWFNPQCSEFPSPQPFAPFKWLNTASKIDTYIYSYKFKHMKWFYTKHILSIVII